MLEMGISEICDHTGRNDFHGKYHHYDKTEERERVADFILRNCSALHRINLLSLPGVAWAFENIMLLHRPNMNCVGLERSVTAYMHARRAMPCHTKVKGETQRRRRQREFGHPQERIRQYGSSHYQYMRADANTFSAHRLLLMCASTFASMLITDYGQTAKERNDFYGRFCARNAVWLDFTSMLCAEVENTLRNLPLCLQSSREFGKPVVVTVLNARDEYHSEEERIARMVAVQPAFEYAEHWTYKGLNDAPMLTVCGLIR